MRVFLRKENPVRKIKIPFYPKEVVPIIVARRTRRARIPNTMNPKIDLAVIVLYSKLGNLTIVYVSI